MGDDNLIWDWHGRLEPDNIPADPAESHDLAAASPELTARLHQQLKQWPKDHVAPRYWPQRDENVTSEAAALALFR